jgi:hypothetical protein
MREYSFFVYFLMNIFDFIFLDFSHQIIFFRFSFFVDNYCIFFPRIHRVGFRVALRFGVVLWFVCLFASLSGEREMLRSVLANAVSRRGALSLPALSGGRRPSSSSSSTVRPEPQSTDSLLTVGTRSIFSEEHDMLREMARGFFNKSVVPHHAQWEEDGQISRDCWREAGSLGLLCVTMPEQYGGAGADILSSAVVWEEQSYTGCTGPGFALHSEIVAPYILNYGTEAQKQKYLPKLASGEWVGAIAMTEPAAGSDLQGMKSTAFQTTPG